MSERENVTDRVLQALVSGEENFGKVLLGEKSSAMGVGFENPLERAFVEYFSAVENREGLRAMALIAILYLSVLYCDFPMRFFRVSVNYLRDNIALLSFNCNLYEKLYEKLSNGGCVKIPLFKNIYKFEKINLTKNQIFDAFDFLSNGL